MLIGTRRYEWRSGLVPTAWWLLDEIVNRLRSYQYDKYDANESNSGMLRFLGYARTGLTDVEKHGVQAVKLTFKQGDILPASMVEISRKW